MSTEARSGVIGHELESPSTSAKVCNGEEEQPGNVRVNGEGAGSGNGSQGTSSDRHSRLVGVYATDYVDSDGRTRRANHRLPMHKEHE